jgi:hypothetical protein
MSDVPIQNIVGSRIESAEHDRNSGSWLIHFANGDSLNIECMWRLLEGGAISSTSEDHAQLFGLDTPVDGVEALIEMGSHKIVSAQCTNSTGDLVIELGQGFSLQVVAISAGYEAWQYKQKGGSSFVAVGGQVHGY